MTKKQESLLQSRIRKALEDEVGGWWMKVHGGPFQVAGVPDLIGTVDGYFFGFEVKTPTGKVSELQKYTIAQMRRKGGACAEVVTSPKEAVDHVVNRVGFSRAVPKGHRRTCD